MTSNILVTGGFGTIGGALVRVLRERGADFAVMSSRADARGTDVPVVQGDFADPASLRRAFAGVRTLFLLLPLVPNKLELARNALAAAREAGVAHIVRSSGAGADAQSPVSLARLQGQIDELVQASGIPATLLRPNSFMQNWVNFHAASLRAGSYHAPNGEGATSMVDVRDIAEAAATVLLNPSAHAGRSYTLTGGEALSNAQMLGAIAEAAGHPVRYVDVPEAAARDALQGMGMPGSVVDWLMSLHHVVKQGWAAGISPDVQALTGHAPRRFIDFVAENAAAWR